MMVGPPLGAPYPVTIADKCVKVFTNKFKNLRKKEKEAKDN